MQGTAGGGRTSSKSSLAKMRWALCPSMPFWRLAKKGKSFHRVACDERVFNCAHQQVIWSMTSWQLAHCKIQHGFSLVTMTQTPSSAKEHVVILALCTFPPHGRAWQARGAAPILGSSALPVPRQRAREATCLGFERAAW